MDDSLPPASPQGTAGPQQPTAAYPTAAYPQPTPGYPQPTPGYPQPTAGYPQPVPPARRSGVVWIVVGSIVGGLLVLGFTFLSGAAVGWFFGSHHAGVGITMHERAFPGDQLPPGWQRNHPGKQNGQNQQTNP